MSQTELALLLTIVGGFVLLALTVTAFLLSHPRFGLVLLLLAGVAFGSSLVVMARFSSDWEQQQRDEVTAKYRVHVTQWGMPLGSDPVWEVNGEITDCVVITKGPDAPVMTCDGEEMPLRTDP